MLTLVRGFAPLLSTDPQPLSETDPEAFFWLRHARRAEGPVVDLHAGNGRIARILAEQEIDVVATEPHPVRLEAGMRRTEGLSVTWTPGPLETVRLDRPPGLIMVAGRLFQRLLTLGEQRAFLARQYQRLAVGGTLIVTLWAPHLPDLAEMRGQVTVLPLGIAPDAGSMYCRETAAATVDPAGRWFTIHYAYEVLVPDGRPPRRHFQSLQLALLWHRECEHLLVRSGFEIEACYGDWSESPFDEHASEQIWVVRKPAP